MSRNLKVLVCLAVLSVTISGCSDMREEADIVVKSQNNFNIEDTLYGKNRVDSSTISVPSGLNVRINIDLPKNNSGLHFGSYDFISLDTISGTLTLRYDYGVYDSHSESILLDTDGKNMSLERYMKIFKMEEDRFINIDEFNKMTYDEYIDYRARCIEDVNLNVEEKGENS